MSVRSERTFSIGLPPERVIDAMRDPGLITESELSRQAVSVDVKDVSRSESRHEYEVHVVSHARTMSGVDKSKTENNWTRVAWDLASRKAEWTWRGEHGVVKISGTYEVKPEGAGSALKLTAEIHVGIPIAGRVLEKKIQSGFESAWPDYASRVERWANKA